MAALSQISKPVSKEITLHPSQVKAFTSKARVTCLVSGIQGGKTTVGGLWARSKAPELRNENDAAIIASPDYKIFSQSTYPRFIEYFRGLGKEITRDRAFKLNRGGTIYLRSMHEPDSCEGITNVRWIWGDEAGKMKMQAWINLSGRSAFTQAPIFLTTTPYHLGWLYRDLYKPWRSGKLPDTTFIQFRSVDNPYFPKAEFERQKAMLDPRVFAMKYEGRFEKMQGLVFADFDQESNTCVPHDAWRRADHYTVVCGVDWGYTNQFALAPRAIHRYEPRDYQLGEFYKTHMTPSEKVQAAKQFQQRYGIETFYCDNEDPAMIEEFNRAGLHAVAAPKFAGSVLANIQDHNEIIRTREYKVFRGCCPNTEEEYETYHFPEPKGDEENPTENPVDMANHLMTANMYVTRCTKHIREARKKRNQFVPAVTRTQQLATVGRAAGEYDW